MQHPHTAPLARRAVLAGAAEFGDKFGAKAWDALQSVSGPLL